MVTGMIAAMVIGQKMPDLLSAAKPIAKVGNWVEGLDGAPNYQWVDAKTIIFAEKFSQEPPRLQFLNLTTGKTRDVDCAQEFGGFGGDFTTLRVSPDGKKVLWGGDSNWYVAAFGQDRIPSFPRKKNRQVASSGSPEDISILSWGKDSDSVIECAVSFNGEVLTSMWSRPINHIEKENPFPTVKGYVDWPARMLGSGVALGVSGTAMGPPKSWVQFMTWSPSHPGSTRKQWTVQVPKGRKIDLFTHSRDGKSILWDLMVANPKSDDPWESLGEELWVSDAQGKRWKPIASIAKSAKVSMPKWIPGDRAISFVSMGKLYRLDLPR